MPKWDNGLQKLMALGIVLVIISLAGGVVGANSEPTIERVYMFPDQYQGQTLVFDNVSLSGELSKTEDVFTLSLKSPEGKYVSSVLVRDGFTFVVSENIASQLLDVVEAKSNYRVRVTSTMKKLKTRYTEYWVADVMKIEFYGRTGQIVQTIK